MTIETIGIIAAIILSAYAIAVITKKVIREIQRRGQNK